MSAALHQIQLPEELERRLRERAAAAGTDAETFILRAIEEKLDAPKSFKELFAPIQQAFGDWPESPDSLEHTLENLRAEGSQTKRPKVS